MIDTVEAIKAWLLKADVRAAVTGELNPLPALIGARVACPDLPEGAKPHLAPTAEDPDAGPWLVFQARGGVADLYVPWVTPHLRLTFWGSTPQQARQIYRAFFDLVHGAENVDLGAAGYIVKAREQVQGQDITDPDTGWPTVVAFFEITMRATA